MKQATGYIGSATRKTVAEAVRISGVGLHSGQTVNLRIEPAEAGAGLTFVGPGEGKIPVSPFHVIETVNAVTLGNRSWKVQTVEHLLAGLAAAGITDAILEIDDHEIPILDGSAAPFYEAVMAAGVRDLGVAVEPIKLQSAVWVVEKDKYLVALPHDRFTVTYSIDFPHPLLRGLSMTADIDSESFVQDFMSARTFGFLRDVETMKAKGLVQGASLDNAVVLTEDGYMNESLRYEDECLRHKVLDLVGDLYLMGRPLQAHVIAFKAGHNLDVNLGKRILTRVSMDELARRKARMDSPEKQLVQTA
ncbi:MAG: UDP-3-O-[3-hydroxymyristoyl] N-acetylglucosamine deacetylase [Spirochaetia bacterium]|nr:UDP-3-O-[3-hydroxymyristoyl] N-acetylglucosamine deacetylase [Spirochaetia bacterium]